MAVQERPHDVLPGLAGFGLVAFAAGAVLVGLMLGVDLADSLREGPHHAGCTLQEVALRVLPIDPAWWLAGQARHVCDSSQIRPHVRWLIHGGHDSEVYCLKVTMSRIQCSGCRLTG